MRANSTLAGLRPSLPGEDLAVAGEDLLGDAVGVEGLDERIAHRTCGCPCDYLGDDTEARMVVDARDDREGETTGELDVAHHVDLPQLHRPGPLPALVVVAPTPPGLGLDQAMAHETAIDRGA
jgi:hypothetical protein